MLASPVRFCAFRYGNSHTDLGFLFSPTKPPRRKDDHFQVACFLTSFSCGNSYRSRSTRPLSAGGVLHFYRPSKIITASLRSCGNSHTKRKAVFRVFKVIRVFRVLGVLRVLRVFRVFKVFKVFKVFTVLRLFKVYKVFRVFKVVRVFRVFRGVRV